MTQGQVADGRVTMTESHIAFVPTRGMGMLNAGLYGQKLSDLSDRSSNL